MFLIDCWKEVACPLFDRMLKVKKKKQKNAEVISYIERDTRKAFGNTRKNIIGQEKRRTCRLHGRQIQVLQVSQVHRNDDCRTHLLLLAVRRWWQQMRTLSQKSRIVSLMIHKISGCNILDGATSCIRGSRPIKHTTHSTSEYSEKTVTNEWKTQAL